jgi:fructosamine-3-kinase
MKGLDLLRANTKLTVPRPIKAGNINGISYLLMENIEAGVTKTDFWIDFGRQLSEIHRITDKMYGLGYDNFIGSLEQKNIQHDDWVRFFIEMRLYPQLELARNSGKIDKDLQDRFEILATKLPQLIPAEPPSLLHGDLWSGNFLTDSSGHAALIDPAVYFGHREMEISFTKLFGGFNSAFYDSYDENYPLEPGFDQRMDIHNLYPLLVHVNLFGTSYLNGIVSTLSRYT